MAAKALLELIYVRLYKSLPTASGANDVTYERAGPQPTVRSEMPSVAENFLPQDAEEPAREAKPFPPRGPGTDGAKPGRWRARSARPSRSTGREGGCWKREPGVQALRP